MRSFADPHLLSDLDWADALFLYRTPVTDGVRELVERARASGRRVIGSIDDLIFVPEPEALPPLDHLGEADRELWIDGVKRYRATLEMCDLFVAPTRTLAEEAERLGWETALQPDAASNVELALADRAAAERPRSNRVTLGYFSGSATHDHDWAEASPAILETLLRHPRTRLRVVGPLRLPAELATMENRIERLDTVPWPDLPALVASVDVNLAPLTWRRRFSAAKGEVKYIEAGAVGVPTVASPSPAFRDALAEGATGRLASNTEEWAEALDDLVRSAELRFELGQAAREDVRRRYSTRARAPGFLALFVSGHSVPPGTGPPPPSSGRVAHEPDGHPDLEVTPDGVSPPVAGLPIEQELPQRENLPSRVDLHTVTFGQSLSHRLHLELRTQEGQAVASVTANGGALEDRTWLALEVPPASRPVGGPLTLRVTASGTGPGDASCLSLASQDEQRLPPARLGSETLPAPLALRIFSAWSEEKILRRIHSSPFSRRRLRT